MIMTIITVAIIPRPTSTVMIETATTAMAGGIRTTIAIGDGGAATATVIETIAARAIGGITAAMAEAIRPFTKTIRDGIAATVMPTTAFITGVEFITAATTLMASRATRKEPLAAILDSAMVMETEPRWPARI